MRVRSWTVHVGPLFVAAALIPTLLGVLAVAAPSQPPRLGDAPGSEASTNPALTSTVPPTLTPAPDNPAALPCTPLRGRRQLPGSTPTVTVTGLINGGGEHIGRRVSLRARVGAEVSVTLPAESFVAQPMGDWLVYGAAGRNDSEVRAIDLETGCDVRLTRLDGIVRGAILDPVGTAVYVHAVDARSRGDVGVTRVDLASGQLTEALPAFESPRGFGAVFATSLRWATDGTTLAVQSCGAEACHTRLLDTASGDLARYRVEHGGLVGVSSSHLFAFAAGHERPAQLLAIARADGTVTVVVEDAYAAELLEGTDVAPVLRVETPAGWQEVAP